MDVNIRQATDADIKELSALATKTWLDAFGDQFSEEERKRRCEKNRSETYFEAALKRDIILVAEEDKALIGYVEFGPPNLSIFEILDGDQELTRLYVLGDRQRQGIGTALLNAALAHPQMQRATNIYIDVLEKNEGAIRLYQRYGFVDTGYKNAGGDNIMIRRAVWLDEPRTR